MASAPAAPPTQASSPPPPVIPMNWTLDYLAWMRSANAGHFQPGNIAALNHAIERIPDGLPIVEIGSFAGLSTNQISALKRANARTNRLITCDPWIFEQIDMSVRVGAHHVTFSQYAEFVRESYIRNVRFFSSDALPSTAQMFSNDFFRAWARNEEVPDVVSGGVFRLGGPIALCFIDGDHQYAAALSDFTNADQFVTSGGYILFDDSADTARGPDGKPWGSWRVATEVAASGRYELVMKEPNYLFRKK